MSGIKGRNVLESRTMNVDKKVLWRKLAACMARAARGEELTIGFLGGSITQGSLASAEDKTYAYRVYRWWCDAFLQAEFHYVNGGIGGTCSCFGAARAVGDLLMYQPDVVVVDFSVNDKGETPEEESFYQETYEGLLRRIVSWPSSPAVLVLNNVYYDSGKTMQDRHNAVAEHYRVPFVSIKDSIYRKMKEGRYSLEELTPDGLHPNDLGHELVAGEVIRLLEEIRAWGEKKGLYTEPGADRRDIDRQGSSREDIDGKDIVGGEILPLPLTQNAYEQAKLLTIRNSRPVLAGFRADSREKKGHLDTFKNGWMGKKAGDRIIFYVDASCIAVQYRKTIQRPAVSARLILDGKQEEAVLLDGNFEESWGDCLYLLPVLHHGERGEHRVEIEVTETAKKGETPFYLLGLIIA
jgi:lysophospholipase L1-like esterase